MKKLELLAIFLLAILLTGLTPLLFRCSFAWKQYSQLPSLSSCTFDLNFRSVGYLSVGGFPLPFYGSSYPFYGIGMVFFLLNTLFWTLILVGGWLALKKLKARGRRGVFVLISLVVAGAFLSSIWVVWDSRKPDTKSSGESTQPNETVGDVWAVIVNNSGFPPNDKFVEGFWAYDLLTKYYKYPKSHIRFLATMNEDTDKWLDLGGVHLLDSFNTEKIRSVRKDILGAPNKQSYVEALEWLKAHSTENDKVIILSFTHGASGEKGVDYDGDDEFDNDDEYLVLGDRETGEVQNFYDGEFAGLAAEIKAKELFIWISACHGGGFYWDIIDRVQKGGNVGDLYIMGPAIDERDVVLVNVDAVNSPSMDLDWPDLYENFFGLLLSGLTGLQESRSNGGLILEVDPPANRTVFQSLEEVYDCAINAQGRAATIGLLDFSEGSEFPMKLAFGCQFNRESKTPEYPDGEATLGYMNKEKAAFSFWMEK